MRVVALREGHGANCSSVGSIIDLLFVTEVALGALYVAVALGLAEGAPEAPNGERDEQEEEP